ncbi:MAG: carboxypeptidase regulatory-like domain-containing protein [Candidatus Yonathbacteria bacterium]|nr:carboxypeptidase regulatory-like domain-containing protein [Candidatus Yonathbacteria bacterium]
MSDTSSTTPQRISKRGFTLINVLVGSALLLMVFMAVEGVFRLSVEIITDSKARIGALALAQESIEYTRSLPYTSVGTEGGIPAGNIPQEETVSLNGVTYTRRTTILYVDDSADGEDDEDENGITTDYKSVRVTIFWNMRGTERSVNLTTRLVPVGIETTTGGGTLVVRVADALLAPVQGAIVHIENDDTTPPVSMDAETNVSGRIMIPGAPSVGSYEVTVSKEGYTVAQTYAVSANLSDPVPGHVSILEGQSSVVSFQIDHVASATVHTYVPSVENSWEDTFSTGDLLSSMTYTVVSGGAVFLDENSEGHLPSGTSVSVDIVPAQLLAWKDMSWNEETPEGTSVRYSLFTAGNGGELLPEAVLPGNLAGFTTSPVDLSGVPILTYPALRLVAHLETTDSSVTPGVLDWTVRYSEGPISVGGVPVMVRGQKTKGTDEGSPVLLYESVLTTLGNGIVEIADLVWDMYTFNVPATSGYDISDICPLQPQSIDPGTHANVDIMLVPHATHSLRVAIVDGDGASLPGATVTLSRGAYHHEETTSVCGQVFFTGLSYAEDYHIDVSLGGYVSESVSGVAVNGTSTYGVTLDAM